MTNREEQRKGRETAVNAQAAQTAEAAQAAKTIQAAQAALREKAVAVTGLSKSYSGKKVIENLNLTIRTGQIYGLLGANSAGKSTAWNVYWGPGGLIREKCGYWGWTR